ncbi:hypothetical protein [Halopiger djelfimassiliensis]|uniref:hypothetical protein n=1 Tax=Halopiger djelfimassiliensis TaxID=1293047 RepID=UPI000677B119|nr:hypothetical protein [Halopiger djelfimassiliensis]
MNSKQQNHVAISTASGVAWHYIIPSAATTCAEQATEITELCSQLFDIFGGFITPIEIKYGIAVYAEDQRPPYDDNTGEKVRTIIRDVRDESGITNSDFVTSTQVAYPGARWIPRVPFDHNRLQLHFPDGDQFIERSDCVAYSKGDPVNRKPTWEPIEIVVKYTKNREYKNIETDYVFRIDVRLFSDVWFSETESGQRNRASLSEFLAQLADTVRAEQIQREVDSLSDMWIDLELQEYSETFDPSDIY